MNKYPLHIVGSQINYTDNESVGKLRSSNLELYRIICMLMIVAHHYVTNSGLTGSGEFLMNDYTSANSIFLTLFGAWGKTGINCFLMITGYFMCTSRITVRKFLKLMLQIYFYRWIFFLFFYFLGYESVSTQRILQLVMPVWNFSNNFVSCFIAFWLTIPFLTLFVQNMSKRQHQLLLLLLLGIYSLLGSIPTFEVTFNYITWFGIIFFIASYIRLYPNKVFDNGTLWGLITLLFIVLGAASILFMRLFVGFRSGLGYSFVADSNKILAVTIAVSSFLWFKSMDIKYNKFINAFGAGTFGVLLIHANSSAMRTWLWKDTIDVASHYTLSLSSLILFSVGIVLAIFIICNLVDQLRIATLEKWFFNWYDRNLSAKVDAFVSKIV